MSFSNLRLPKDLVETAARVLEKIRSGSIAEKSDDELLKKKAKVDAESGLPELGESGAACSANDADDDNKIIKGPPGMKRMAAMKEDEEEESPVSKAASTAAAIAPLVAGDDICPGCEKPKADCSCSEVKENYASPEPSSAVGFRTEVETPKHANVIHDANMVGGVMEHSYRLLVVYPNQRCEIVPSAEHAGASSVQELLSLTSHIVDPKNVLGEAIADAMMIPSNEPRFRGNDK